MDEIGLVDYEGSWHPEEGSSGSATEYYYPARGVLTTSPDPEAVSAASTPMDLSSVLGSLFGLSGSGFDNESLNSLIDQYKSFILENTNYNNAWSAEQAEKMMDFQRSEREWAQLFNQGEAAKNRDWQKMMSDTAHQREVADLKAAGLNPILSAKGGNGASVGSGATAASSVPGHGAQGNPDQSANSAITGFLGTAFSAMANMASKMVDAQTSLAVATKYTDMERIIESMKEEFSAWEHEHYPSNLYEAMSAVIAFLGGDGKGSEGLISKGQDRIDDFVSSHGASYGTSGKKVYDWLVKTPAFNQDSWVSKFTRSFDEWLEKINPFHKSGSSFYSEGGYSGRRGKF